MSRKQILLLFSFFFLRFSGYGQQFTGGVQPTGITLAPFQQQQFTVAATSQPLEWWIRPFDMGTITQNGLYTAPGICGIVYIHATPKGSKGPFYISTIYLSGGPQAQANCPTAPPAATTGISLNPSFVYLQTGQSATFQAMIGGTPSNSPMQWSLNPNLGSIVNGVYTAPASLGNFGHEALVTISATSLTNAGETGTATVLLGQPISPVSISIAPGPTALTAGQSAQYTASVSGAANTGVNWSLTPNLGTIFNGLYTSPTSISSPETVTLIAISQADPSKTASVTVTLNPANVSVSLTPSSASLTGGQSTVFQPVVNGTSNAVLNWSLNPGIGSINSGIYQAPAVIPNQQTVTVTATSAADATKSASVTVWLQPIAVTIGPASVSVGDGGSANFAASVSGASNTAVAWTLNPPVGTVVNGLYSAPAVIGSPQTITLTAASMADPTKTASASITLTSASLSVSPGSASLTGGQTATFTPFVSGTTNTAVTWSLSPQVGTVANGVYQAPAVIASQQVVTVTATSAADASKSASANVALQPVGVTVGPASVSLGDGGSTNFTASVTGTTNSAVTWSLNPPIGTVVNGVYNAPAQISSSQTVTLTATSAVDPTKTATAIISLTAVGVSLSPGTTSLAGGQSATFQPVVSGTSNTGLTWSLNPQVGTISNGVYQAPAVITSQQMVTVSAASLVDPTKSATAIVTLQPIGVSVAPASASLNAGQSAAFTASLTGTSNTAVTWSMSPSLGTLVNGNYTAPASIVGQQTQTVVVTATSTADPTKTATAVVNLTPNPTTSSTVTLPVEVLGANGTTVTNTVNIATGTSLSGQLVLWMQVHGLRTQTQASVQVNNSGWFPINSSTVTLLGNAAAYGGIGGGFSTLKMTMNLPAGVVVAGANTISFRFNQTDGRVSGFRVLAFNIQSNGNNLIDPSTFVNDDPNAWQPPSTNPTDIATGQTLWHQAALTSPGTTGNPTPILAHCSDCHAQDGRDLKYFNYSNNSIQARSVFHGLTPQQGDQIASYIRSLNVVNPGRPWNPPYQPGPGLDSQPVSNWAAGAGLNAVLDTDQEMINAIFPTGIQASVFAPTSYLNQRELPLDAQLPDWNQWLPGTFPADAFGNTFTTNGYNTIYQSLSASLQAGNPASYVAQKSNFDNWFMAYYGLYNQLETPMNNNQALWTPSAVDAMYSLAQWGMVKTWEMMNQFQLEGYAQNMFGAQADQRAWYSQLPFFVSPHELKMPNTGEAGLRNGSRADYVYLSYIWYNLQLILNDGNGKQSYQFPIDWGYVYGLIKDMGSLIAPQGGIQTMWMIKGLQVMQQQGVGPQASGNGWQTFVVQPSWLVTPEWDQNVWEGVDSGTRTAIANGIASAWLSQVNQFTPQQFYAGGWTTATAVPVPGGNPYDSVFPDWVWYMIPRFSFLG